MGILRQGRRGRQPRLRGGPPRRSRRASGPPPPDRGSPTPVDPPEPRRPARTFWRAVTRRAGWLYGRPPPRGPGPAFGDAPGAPRSRAGAFRRHRALLCGPPRPRCEPPGTFVPPRPQPLGRVAGRLSPSFRLTPTAAGDRRSFAAGWPPAPAGRLWLGAPRPPWRGLPKLPVAAGIEPTPLWPDPNWSDRGRILLPPLSLAAIRSRRAFRSVCGRGAGATGGRSDRQRGAAPPGPRLDRGREALSARP